MNAKQKAKWVKALRSGKLKQGVGCLHTSGNRYCCLGVANEVCNLRVPGAYGHISSNIKFLPQDIQTELVRFNDDLGMPFDLIAGFIDCYIEPTE